MRKPIVAAAALTLAGCEATLMSQQLDYHEMQGVGFTVHHEEDAVLGGARIVTRAYNSHPQPVCARLAGHTWVIVPAGQTAILASQDPGVTGARHEVGPVKPNGRC